MMKKMLFLLAFVAFVSFADDSWKAVIVPNANVFIQMKGEILKDENHQEVKKDENAIEEKMNFLSEADQKKVKDAQKILTVFAEAFKDMADANAVYVSGSIATEQSAVLLAVEINKPVKPEDIVKKISEEYKAKLEKLEGLEACTLTFDAKEYSTLFSKDNKLFIIGSKANIVEAAKRLNSHMFSELTKDMNYVSTKLKGNNQVVYVFSSKDRETIASKAVEMMATEPVQGMALSKLSGLSAFYVESFDQEKGSKINLGLVNPTADGAAAMKAELFDGMIMPMAKSLAEAFAPGIFNTDNMLASSLNERIAVLSISLKKEELEFFKNAGLRK